MIIDKVFQQENFTAHTKELTEWVPPNLKKLDLPTIEIPEENAVDKYHYWLDAHPEINRAVPPIYKDFTIRFSKSFTYPDRPKVIHDYIDIVHYSDDLCAFAVCHVIDGKKKLISICDYDWIKAQNYNIICLVPHINSMSDEFIQTEPSSPVSLTIAIQNFLFLHKPEIIPTVLPKSDRRSKPTTVNTQKQQPHKKVKDTVKQYIRLDGTIPKVRTYHYNKLQWQVRGHYRKTTHDKKPCLIYIAPHYAKRDGIKCKVKVSQPVTEITANPLKKENESLPTVSI